MPFKSKAQMRLFFAKEKQGELPKGTAKRWAAETPSIKKLPEHKKTAGFTGGILKMADNLAEQARESALFGFDTYVQGQHARENAETGQRKKKNFETVVRNEKREMNPQYKVKYFTSRGGRPNGYND